MRYLCLLGAVLLPGQLARAQSIKLELGRPVNGRQLLIRTVANAEIVAAGTVITLEGFFYQTSSTDTTLIFAPLATHALSTAVTIFIPGAAPEALGTLRVRGDNVVVNSSSRLQYRFDNVPPGVRNAAALVSFSRQSDTPRELLRPPTLIEMVHRAGLLARTEGTPVPGGRAQRRPDRVSRPPVGRETHPRPQTAETPSAPATPRVDQGAAATGESNSDYRAAIEYEFNQCDMVNDAVYVRNTGTKRARVTIAVTVEVTSEVQLREYTVVKVLEASARLRIGCNRFSTPPGFTNYGFRVVTVGPT